MSELAMRSKVAIVNRIGYPLLTWSAITADAVNCLLDYRASHPEWLGGVTNHVGDVIWGVNAANFIKFTPSIFQGLGASERNAKTMANIGGGLIVLGLVAAEMGGVLNSPDAMDLPGIAVGLLGGLLTYKIKEIPGLLTNLKIEAGL